MQKRGISCDGNEYCLNESEDWEGILIISGFGHEFVRSWGLTLFLRQGWGSARRLCLCG